MFSVNDTGLFIVAALIILYVLIQSIVFFAVSWRRAKQLGLDMKKLRSVLFGTAIFTLAPAFAIIIGMISLAKFLGLPLPWLRLSVLGALTYELPAATTAANAMGVSISETITKPEVYSAISWVMTCGILSGIVIITLFLKKMQKGIHKIKGKDEKWGRIFTDSLFLGMISAFLGMIFSGVSKGIKGWLPVFVMLISSLVMLICGYFVKNKKQAWLENYALPMSMLLSMALAIPLSMLIGG